MSVQMWKKAVLLGLLALTVSVSAACNSGAGENKEQAAQVQVEKTAAELEAEQKLADADAELKQAQADLAEQEVELKVKEEEQAKKDAEAKAAAEAQAKAAEEAAKAEADAKAAEEEAKRLAEEAAKAKANANAAEAKRLAEAAAKAKTAAVAKAAAAKAAAEAEAKAEAELAAKQAAAEAANKKRAEEEKARLAAQEEARKLEEARKAEEARLAEERRIAEEFRQAEAERKAKLTGTVKVDGSSTVYPISEAVAASFNKEVANVRVPVAVSGTGGGFSKFCKGETDVSNASRPIKQSEIDACKKGNIDYVAFEVAYDGLTVVINQNNDWAKNMTQAELKKIFMPGSTVKTWKDVRDTWPDETIKIYSPGTASGTFDYFTEHINGKAGASRNDSQVTFSENDNVLVQGVSGSKYAIGYFGFSYYEENMSKLNAVFVDSIEPTYNSIQNKSYPLSRMLYVYFSKAALSRPEVKEFATFYNKNVGNLVKGVGYIKLPQSFYDANVSKIPN